MIDVPCSKCGTLYHAEWAHLGKCIQCSQCGSTVFIIESAKAAALYQPPRGFFRAAFSAQSKRSLAWRAGVWIVGVLGFSVIFLFGSWYWIGNRSTANPSGPRNVAEIASGASDTGTANLSDVSTDEVANLHGPGAEVVAPNTDTSPAQQREQRPRIYESLPTGTPFCGGSEMAGRGVLEIQNGTLEDAALRIYDVSHKQVIRCLFVKAHESVRVSGLRQGAYDLRYTTGLDWQAEAQSFRWLPTYNQFGQQLVYSEEKIGDDIRYRRIKITLQPVIGGNVRSVPISREEFLRGSADVSLRR